MVGQRRAALRLDVVKEGRDVGAPDFGDQP
jgi:hypothetical protein